ncbi:MAG: amidohydrolase family protein [Polyangiaceae bacterium]
MFDLKIKGGRIVDGTGAPAFEGDVAIQGDKIVAVGDAPGDARRTIDATGCIVTPGFVDVHTHYDGQVTWDADLAPSCFHGVTTAVIGNCGVGFAPVREADRKRLIELMEGVEDIPGTALHEGIRWRWESFPEFMDAIDTPKTIDVVTQVTHDALRVFVMGERAVANVAANDEEIAEMGRLVRAAVEAGAAGFSTGRTDNHRAIDGSATPAADATKKELVGIASALADLGHGVVQAVSDFDMERGPSRFDEEFDVLEAMVAASKKRGSLSLLQRDLDTEQWKRIVARAERASAAGHVVRLQCAARGIGVLLGLTATFHPFIGYPSYKRIALEPLEARVRAMRDPAFKAQLLSEKSERIAGDGSNVPPMADRFLEHIDFISMKIFRLGASPNYEPTREDSLFAESMRRGVRPLEALYDALLEDDGKELLYFPVYNYAEMNLDAVGEMLRHPLALAGLSDGGAHVGTICDASFPTFMLTHWARDRATGRIPLERVVEMLTRANALHIGLADRGVLAPGLRADVNVIDHAGLRLSRPRIAHDLPAGGRRLLQDAAGYRATILKGDLVSQGGELTGARPGRLVRVG